MYKADSGPIRRETIIFPESGKFNALAAAEILIYTHMAERVGGIKLLDGGYALTGVLCSVS